MKCIMVFLGGICDRVIKKLCCASHMKIHRFSETKEIFYDVKNLSFFRGTISENCCLNKFMSVIPSAAIQSSTNKML